MMIKFKQLFFCICVGAFWLGLTLVSWVHQPGEISETERRSLAQLPQLEYNGIVSGKYMKDFESYAKDQFPKRFEFRTIKAITRFYVFLQKDTNDIYIEEGYAAKLDFPLNEKSVNTALDKFNYLYEKYMKDQDVKVYLSIVPDKGYFLSAQNGYPSMDYVKLLEQMQEGMTYATYIDITKELSLEDYYKTDIHWRQENLIDVAAKLGSALGISEQLSLEFKSMEAEVPFYGVYYGQSALPLKSEGIHYLTNEVILNCRVNNIETQLTTPVYDIEKLTGRDPYDVYLSGATPLLEIENPKAETDKELIVFRDSFGSSLVPLLLEGYSKVTLVDIRYINSNYVGEYVEFTNQDVLFLYSTSILNAANTLK